MEYPKIETLFVRDETTKKLIFGKFINETVEYLKNNVWEFTEKVDGINIRIIWDGYKVTFGGRTNNAQIPRYLLARLEELFGGNVNEQMFEQKFGENHAILFGEGFGKKIQKGGLYRNTTEFILFDVFIGNMWLRRESVENIAKYFNIEVVPPVLRGTIDDGINYLIRNRKSTVAHNGHLLEGLIGLPAVELNERNGKRVIVKIKYEDFEGLV